MQLPSRLKEEDGFAPRPPPSLPSMYGSSPAGRDHTGRNRGIPHRLLGEQNSRLCSCHRSYTVTDRSRQGPRVRETMKKKEKKKREKTEKKKKKKEEVVHGEKILRRCRWRRTKKNKNKMRTRSRRRWRKRLKHN